MRKKEIILVVILCIITAVVVHFYDVDDNEIILDTTYETLVNDTQGEEVVIDAESVIKNLTTKYNNTDIKAELRIKNTTFKTPIPQGKNNNYYYRRLPNKSYSIIGSTYLDYRTNIDESRVLIIYGHNSTKYDMPFKILENYYSKDYYDNHRYIELITSNGVKVYEIFSIYVETKDFSYYTDVEFKNNDEFLKHITSLKEKSLYDTGVELSKEDDILILQACSTHKKYQKYKNKFVLIISKEVKNNESN